MTEHRDTPSTAPARAWADSLDAPIAWLVNLAALLIGLLLFRWRDRFYVDPAVGAISGWAVLFYLGQALLLWGAAPLATALLIRLRVPRRLALGVVSLYFGLLFVYLYIDLVVAGLFQRHLTWYWIKLLSEPTAWTDLGLGLGELLAIAGGVVLISLAEYGLFRWARRWRAALRQRTLPLALLALLLGAASYLGWSLYAHRHGLRALQDTRLVPLFFPREHSLGLTRLWRWLGIGQRSVVIAAADARHQYARSVERQSYREFRQRYQLPATVSARQRYDILIIAAESWRWDTLTPQGMPQLWRYSQRLGWRAPAHFSTGNTTPEGVFGIFAGLSPLFWQPSKEGGFTPLLFHLLKRLGYRLVVTTANNFAYRHSNRYVFGTLLDQLTVFDTLKNAASTRRWKKRPLHQEDQQALAHYLAQLKTRRAGQPQLDLLYFYAPHYNYYHPASMTPFRPSMPADFSVHDFDIRNKAPRLYNRYRNAVYFFDSLIGQVLQTLEQSGRLKRTIVVITGDHGEEFFERGRFGHAVGLNNFQLRVPLVIIAPQRFHSRYRISSHADLAPTLLRLLGVSLPLAPLFTGKALTEFDTTRDYALIASMEGRGILLDHALVTPTFRAHFVNLADRIRWQRVYTFDGSASRPLSEQERRKATATVNAEKRYFLRWLRRRSAP